MIQIFGQIVSIRIKTLGNKNTVASRLIKREKGLLPVDVRRSKTSLLKLPNGEFLQLMRRKSGPVRHGQLLPQMWHESARRLVIVSLFCCV